MRFLPDAHLWIEGDAERLVVRARAWQTVVQTLIGPRRHDEQSNNDDPVYLRRAITVESVLRQFESNLRIGLPVDPERIAAELDWVLEHVSPSTRAVMLDHYTSLLVDAAYDQMLAEFIKLRDALGSDSPKVEKLRLQLLAKWDQIQTAGHDRLRALLELHPGAMPRIPMDIKKQLGMDIESDDNSGRSDS